MSGIDAIRFGKIATHTLSPAQLVAGDDRRIHHGISLARDIVSSVGPANKGCAMMDADFEAGFDWLTLVWVWLVLRAKGC